jgi:hypothetical protein
MLVRIWEDHKIIPEGTFAHLSTTITRSKKLSSPPIDDTPPSSKRHKKIGSPLIEIGTIIRIQSDDKNLWNLLPLEVIGYIFTNFMGFQEFKMVRQVCSTWRKVAKERTRLQKLDLVGHYYTSQKYIRLLIQEYGQYLTYIDLSWCSHCDDGLIYQISQHVPQLRSLILDGTHTGKTCQVDPYLLFPHLKYLSVGWCNVMNFFFLRDLLSTEIEFLNICGLKWSEKG